MCFQSRDEWIFVIELMTTDWFDNGQYKNCVGSNFVIKYGIIDGYLDIGDLC